MTLPSSQPQRTITIRCSRTLRSLREASRRTKMAMASRQSRRPIPRVSRSKMLRVAVVSWGVAVLELMGLTASLQVTRIVRTQQGATRMTIR